MHHTITSVKFRSLLLLLLAFSLSAVWAQNPVVSLAGSSCIPSTLTVTSSATPTQVVIYQNGSAVSTSTSTSYLASVAGTYYAAVTTAGGTSNTNSITVAGPTAPAISIAAIPGSTSICAGTNVNFNATATNGGTAPAYQWQKNGTNVATGPTYTTNALANGDAIKCILTSNIACATPATATSNTITYTITAPVTPSVSIASYTGNSFCSGSAALFLAAPVNGGTSPAYQWYINNNLVQTTVVDSFTTTTLNNGDVVSCKMVTSVPCATVETVASNNITVAVSTSVTPTATITVTPGNTICAGATVTFSATGTNGGTNVHYQWIQDGLAVSGATGTTYSPASLFNGDSIRVTMTSNAACASAPLVSSNTIDMTVNPVGAPTITISTPGGLSVCTGDAVTFTAAATFGGTVPQYTWLKNGTTVSGPAASATYTATGINTNDTITATITSNQACATSTTATSNQLGFTTYPHLTMTLSIAANPGTSITAGDVVTFTATAANTGANFSYQWYVNGVAKAGSISPTYSTTTLADNDIVTCRVTSTTPCVSNPIDTSNAIPMHVMSGVASVSRGAMQVALNPNPTNGTFTINGTIADGAKDVNVEIYNLLGQVIYTNTIAVTNGMVNKQIILPASMANGMYQVKLKTNSTSEILKFVLSK